MSLTSQLQHDLDNVILFISPSLVCLPAPSLFLQLNTPIMITVKTSQGKVSFKLYFLSFLLDNYLETIPSPSLVSKLLTFLAEQSYSFLCTLGDFAFH